MTSKEIIILLKLLDVTQTSVANKLKMTVPAVNSVIKGLRKNPRIRQAIADAVGRPVHQIWPPNPSPTNKDKQVKHHTKESEPLQDKKRKR
jgi:lambda repressor-like predicted transcriptional regulator